MQKNPLVSIIIPTYNSEKYLNASLKSIKNQTYKKLEIIIVDQSSTDKTSIIAKKYKVKYIQLPAPKFYSPPSHSRNVGAKIAKGEILYHLDSDMELSKNLISNAVDLLGHNCGALIVHEKDLAIGFWAKCKALERRCYWGNDSIESARIVKKSIFTKIKGYDETISSGEDFDIQRRYKKITKVGFCKNVVYHNLAQLNFRKMVIKKFNYGKTAKTFLKKKEHTNDNFIKAEFLAYISHLPFLIKYPVHTLGFLILRVSEILALTFGYISGKNS